MLLRGWCSTWTSGFISAFLSWWTDTRLIRSHPQQRQKGWRVGVSTSPPRHGGRDSIPSHCRSPPIQNAAEACPWRRECIFRATAAAPIRVGGLENVRVPQQAKSEFVVRCLVRPRYGGRSCQEPEMHLTPIKTILTQGKTPVSWEPIDGGHTPASPEDRIWGKPLGTPWPILRLRRECGEIATVWSGSRQRHRVRCGERGDPEARPSRPPRDSEQTHPARNRRVANKPWR